MEEKDFEILERIEGKSREEIKKEILEGTYKYKQVKKEDIEELTKKYWDYISNELEISGMTISEAITEYFLNLYKNYEFEVLKEDNIENNKQFLDKIKAKMKRGENKIYLIGRVYNRFGKIKLIEITKKFEKSYSVNSGTLHMSFYTFENIEKPLTWFYVIGFKPENDKQLIQLIENEKEDLWNKYDNASEGTKKEIEEKVLEDFKDLWGDMEISEEEEKYIMDLQFYLWTISDLKFSGWLMELESEQATEDLNYRFKSNITGKTYQIYYDSYSSPKGVRIVEED